MRIRCLLAVTAALCMTYSAASGDGPSGDAPLSEEGSQTQREAQIPPGYGRSGYADDEIFITDTGYNLDQYLYHDGGPIEFPIEVDRVFSKTGEDWEGLILEARLVLRVWDVDEECEPGRLPERDYVHINGHLCHRDESGTGGHLTGADGSWSIWKFEIPVEWFEDGWIQTATWRGDGEAPLPGINDIRIDIDANLAGWAVMCDWGKLEITGVRPALLVHGLTGSRDSWSDFRTYIEGGLCECARVPSRGWVSANSQRVAAEFDSMLVAFGVDRANLIAHSKGGLDSRYWMASDYAPVDHFVMLGTPNHGSEYANHLIGYSPFDVLHLGTLAFLSPGVLDLATWAWAGHDTVRAGDVRTIAGDAFSWLQTRCEWPHCAVPIFTERNDGRVAVSSAAAPGQTTADEVERLEHGRLIRQPRIYDDLVGPWLRDPMRAARSAHREAFAAYVPVRQRVTPVDARRFGQTQHTPFMERTIIGGGALEESVTIADCSEAIFTFVGESRCQFGLRSPDGVVIDKGYANSHSDVSYDASAESPWMSGIAFTVSEPDAGEWRVIASADTTTQVTVLVGLMGDL